MASSCTATSPIVNKLQSSIRNQLIGGHAQLILRGFDFSSTLVRLELRPILTSAQIATVSHLDVSYSNLSWETLSELCQCLPHLQSLKAVECHLPDTPRTIITWPTKLVSLNLSRNKLHHLPGGVGNLMKLETINLSGNHLVGIDQELLQLPKLREVNVVNNGSPLENIPKEVCRNGVSAMRRHLNVKPLPIAPETNESEPCQTHDQQPSFLPAVAQVRARRKLTLQSDTTDSDYCSVVSLPLSSSSCSTPSDRSLSPSPAPPSMSYTSFSCPPGYTKDYQSNYCQVLLPRSTPPDVEITIAVVRDDCLSPFLPHELLATPVVRVEPHGLVFPINQPALIVLPFCSLPQPLLQCTPLCSNTSHLEPPHWERLASSHCEVYDDCVVIATTHFSLFAAVSYLDYPSVEKLVSPQVGGVLETDHLPDFQLVIPPNSIQEATLFRATVLYAREPYHSDEEEMALASACIALEPHGLILSKPVTVSLPIPDGQAILGAFPLAQLKLFVTPTADQLVWQHLANTPIELVGDLAKFQVNHFSLFKFVWSIPSETLRKIRSGASYVYRYMRTQSLSVRCQVLMTPPLPSELSFGLLVIVFKFGDPLREVANYKWILADSGDKRLFLKTGDVQVSLRGLKFKPLTQLEESDNIMSKDIAVSFSGEDFCLRAEFALQLEELTLPIPDWQLLGKLTITQWDGTQCVEMNLSKVHTSITIL